MMATTQIKTSFVFDPAAKAGSVLTTGTAARSAATVFNMPPHFKVAAEMQATATSAATLNPSTSTITTTMPAAGSSDGGAKGGRGAKRVVHNLAPSAMFADGAASASLSSTTTSNQKHTNDVHDSTNTATVRSCSPLPTEGFSLKQFGFAIPTFAPPPTMSALSMPPPPPRPTKRRRTGRDSAVACESREQLFGFLPHPSPLAAATASATPAAQVTALATTSLAGNNCSDDMDGRATRPSSPSSPPASPYSCSSSDADSSSSDEEDEDDNVWMLRTSCQDELELLDDWENLLDTTASSKTDESIGEIDIFHLTAIDIPTF